MRTGFIGLGNMGLGMALALRRADLPVVVYDVDPSPVARLVAAGALAAATPAAVGRQADTVVLMVRTDEQLRAVLFGPDGLASGLATGAIVIVSATISPAQTRSLAAELAPRGVHYLDAPVSGGTARAAEASLTIMVGGDGAVLERARPVLAAMAANIYHAGPVGHGQLAKACNQLMAGVALAATAECLTLAQGAGLDPNVLIDVITHGTGDCWMFRNRAQRMLDDDATTHGRLDIFAKDLGIVLETAEQTGATLLTTEAAREWVLRGLAAGDGGLDDSAIVRAVRRAATNKGAPHAT